MKARRVHLIQLIYAIYTPIHPAYMGGTLRSFGPRLPVSGLNATFLISLRPDESDCEDCKLTTYFSPSILVLVLFPCVVSYSNP